MEKVYSYMEIGEENPIEKTEKEILEEYWDFWSNTMITKFGKDCPLITHENCIADWIVIYWAEEKK